MLVTGVAAAFSIPAAQSLVALSFENPSARVKAFGAWGACGSSGFVCEPRNKSIRWNGSKLINPKFRAYPGWRVYFAGFLGMGMLPSDVFINHDYDGWLTRADLLDLPHC